MSRPPLIEIIEEGSIVHIIHRGTRGFEIVKDKSDKWHFLKALYFTNDRNASNQWNREIASLASLSSSELDKDAKIKFKDLRSKTKWGPRETYVDILAYSLMPNHLHIVAYIKEPEDLGRFMHRFSISMAMYFNKKYETKGNLFEGKYKLSIIGTDDHLDFILPYVIYKNPCELFPGGIRAAIKNPDKAFKFASEYSFGSLGDLINKRPQSDIVNEKVLLECFKIPRDIKEIKKWLNRYLKDRPNKESDTDYIME